MRSQALAKLSSQSPSPRHDLSSLAGERALTVTGRTSAARGWPPPASASASASASVSAARVPSRVRRAAMSRACCSSSRVWSTCCCSRAAASCCAAGLLPGAWPSTRSCAACQWRQALRRRTTALPGCEEPHSARRHRQAAWGMARQRPHRAAAKCTAGDDRAASQNKREAVGRHQYWAS